MSSKALTSPTMGMPTPALISIIQPSNAALVVHLSRTIV